MKHEGGRVEEEIFEFQKTEIYQQIMDYVNRIYKVTKIFPEQDCMV
jgi:hypothetical protein